MLSTRLCRVLVCLALTTVGLDSPVVACPMPQGCTALPPGAVGWWRGEGDGSDSVGANHGVLENGAQIGSGYVGSGFAFDGVDDHVAIDDDDRLDFGDGAFTMEFWFRTTSTSAGAMLSKFDSGLPLFTLLDDYVAIVLNSGGTLEFRFVDFDTVTSRSATTPGSYNDGGWHHIAAVRLSASTARLYVDGVEVASVTGIDDVGLDTNGRILMGAFRYGDAVVGLYEGDLDEVTLYDRALTATEIGDIYRAGADGKFGQDNLGAAVSGLAAQIDALPLSLFVGPNDRVRRERRSSLAIRVRHAADRIYANPAAARALLTGALAKMQGRETDWIRPSAARDAVARCLLEILVLLG